MKRIKNNFSLVDKTFSKTLRKKYKRQRKERGFDSTELWNLDTTLLRFLLPRLKAFEEETIGTPVGFSNIEWHSLLKETINNIELLLKDDIFLDDKDSSEQVCNFLCNHLFKLWW